MNLLTGNAYGSGAASSVSASSSLPEIEWRGIGGAVGAALGASLLFLPAPFLRTLNGIPLALFSSIGLLLGALAAWAGDGFAAADSDHFFRPVLMIGGAFFSLFVVMGVLATRMLGLVGSACIVSGGSVVALAAVHRWGLPAIKALDFVAVAASDAKDPQWLEYAGAIAIAAGAVIGIFLPVRDMLTSKHAKDGYTVIQEINAELGAPYEDMDDVDPLAQHNSSVAKRKKRHSRPNQGEALADSSLTRWFVRRSIFARRIIGLICALVAGVLGILQLAPLLYEHARETVGSSVSVVETFKELPVSDLFAFACGAMVTSVAFVIFGGLIACNKPSLPPQGALPCLAVGALYAASLLAWLWSRSEITGALADSTSWGLVPFFAALWGLVIREQRGIAGHLLAALCVIVVAGGSAALLLSQRGIHNF